MKVAQATVLLSLVLLGGASAESTQSNPMSMVLQLLTGLEAKIVAEGEKEAKAPYCFPDLNAKDLPGAMNIIEGTCKSMGIQVEG